MPQIVILALAAGEIIAGGVTTMMIVGALAEAVMIAASYAMYSGGEIPGTKALRGNGFLDNTQSPDGVLPVIYGRYRVGGNRVYVNSTGENNKFLHIIMTLGEGQIEGIETLYLDDLPASAYGSLVYYEFFSGDGSQGVCTTLQGFDANWSDYMRHTAYLYVRLEYNAEKFTGIPRITAVVKGKKLYDPRNGGTSYSNNPALVWYDYMTNKRYGMGIPTSLMDAQSVIDAANWCESQYFFETAWLASHAYVVGDRVVPATGSKKYHYECVTAGTSGVSAPAWPTTSGTSVTDGTVTWRAVENTYTFNGVMAQRQPFLDNLTLMLNNFRGDVIWSGGAYKLLIRKYDTPVMSLTEDEVVADGFKFSVPGLADTPNRIKVSWGDEATTDSSDFGWVVRDMFVEDSAAVLQYDLEERDADFPLIGTTNQTQARLLATYNLERMRLNKIYSFAAHPRALALEPGDMIQVTHTLPGWTNRVVRVIDVRLAQDGLVALTVQEEDAALYDAVLNLSPATYFSTTLPDPLSVVPEATGVSFTEQEYFNKDVSYTRLKVTFNNPTSPFWAKCQVWVNVDGAGYNHYTDANGSFMIEPVKEGVNYKVKLLSTSINDIVQPIATATEWSYNVIGKNTPPGDVANFRAIPQSDTIILLWDTVNALDLQEYEIRRGTNWPTGIFIATTRSLSYAMNGVAPGSHSFMIKSIDTNGRHSDGYGMATATVYGPASYTEKMSEYDDFSSPVAWAASTAYSLGNRRTPTTPNGFYYQCITAGTSAATEPTTWPTSNGGTVADGGVTWSCRADHAFTNSEAYYDATAGWELRVIHDSDEFRATQDLKAGGDGAKLAGWKVLNSANADAIDINTTNAEKLTVNCNATSTPYSQSNFLPVFVFKEVTGDFDIETYLETSNHDANYEGAFLLARDPSASANQDDLGIGVHYSDTSWVKWHNWVNGTIGTNAFTAGDQRYFRITRAGQVFTVYSKAAAGDSWTQRAQFNRTTDGYPFGSTIQVGVASYTGNTTNTYVTQWDYFRKVNGNLSGTYLSPVYDRGSSLTRRSWLAYDYLFEGTGAAWYDQFSSSDLWTSKFAGADTWLKLFGPFSAGTLKLEFGYSTDGTTWLWSSNFESFSAEFQTRYVRWKGTITDVEAGGYLHLKANFYKEAYFL